MGLTLLNKVNTQQDMVNKTGLNLGVKALIHFLHPFFASTSIHPPLHLAFLFEEQVLNLPGL
jgi:hypothetical protein